MICCNKCGETFESRSVQDIVQVYDEHKNTWVTACPNCGSDELFEEESDEYDQEDAN